MEEIEKVSEINWAKVITNKNIPFTILTNVAPTKGNITYEYNPFHNYRIQQNMYEYKNGLYNLGELWDKFRITLDCEITNKNGPYEIKKPSENYDIKNTGKIISEAFKKGKNVDRINLEKAIKDAGITGWVSLYNTLNDNTNPILKEAGEIVDFITNELNFDLEHPVEMLPQYSYDGSVNLILNDGKNSPKLINSRFSATGKNTYEVCDRKGNNDTNIYDQGEAFEIDTSLYKQTTTIAQLKLNSVEYGGVLKVGNYNFYFKLSDADGNESDFIAESGLVQVFIGSDSYKSVTTGVQDQNSHKQISFNLSNLDTSYDYVHVYYSRSSAEGGNHRATEYVKINKDYPINNARLSNIYITGYEPITNITAEDINLQFNIVDSAYTSAICQNRLFMGNVHKPDIPYMELQDLSLRILPYIDDEAYDCELTKDYALQSKGQGYIDPVYTYYKTGYWTGELYRLGIVYILPDNTLSPVFNIRGGCNVGLEDSELSDSENKSTFSKVPLYDGDGNRNFISYNEENYQLIYEDSISKDDESNKDEVSEDSKKLTNKRKCLFENVKGVVQFKSESDTNTVHSIKMVIPNDVKQELSKYVKGYFFVRQPRIPLVLAQGITIGIDKESGIPTIPTTEGIVDTVASNDLSKTHVTVGQDNGVSSTIKGLVYAAEGFLSRYQFKFTPKSSSIWSQIGKYVGMAVALIGAAAATVFSLGLAAPALITVGIVAAGVLVGSALIPTIVATVQEINYGLQRARSTKTYNRWETPVPSGYKIEEIDDSRNLVQDFDKRIILTASDQNYIAGILCPEFALNQSFYNMVFTGNEHLIESTKTQGINTLGDFDGYFSSEGRHFYIPEYTDLANKNTRLRAKIVGVTDNQKIGCIEDVKYRARAGEAEEAFRYECIGNAYKSNETKDTGVDDEETIDNRKINSDIVRGSYGPFLGFYDKDNTFGSAETVNIYTAGYDDSKLEQYVYQRCCDANTFFTISDRYELKQNISLIKGQVDNSDIKHNIYRGDCFICQYTQRINRNFQDPSAPFNDDIVETNTWKENYDPVNSENNSKINLGDVNAIQLGMWVTFRVRASSNLNIRTEDGSFVEESAMTNSPRTYYPKTPMSVEGVYKKPESAILNDGFRKLLGERYNFELPDIPWIKNWYGTRIMYSNINVSDSFQNGFRIFKGQNYRDYTREYGSIIKLVSLESSLLCVFEHGVALIPVNERTVAGDGPGGQAYINTSNVLPENPRILSDVFGSQWADSVLKVPGKFGDNVQYVYGVDTVARKIWRTDGQTLTCISDLKVQEFLNNNISLTQKELTPKLGIRNVKTFYNAFKRDVLFTFYDNTYGFEEKVWNLCWNELMERFTTFYSWIPSNMENINNIPFSFNRNTTKWISKLGISHASSSFADGITLSNVIVENPTYHTESKEVPVYKDGKLDLELINIGKCKDLDVEQKLDWNEIDKGPEYNPDSFKEDNPGWDIRNTIDLDPSKLQDHFENKSLEDYIKPSIKEARKNGYYLKKESSSKLNSNYKDPNPVRVEPSDKWEYKEQAKDSDGNLLYEKDENGNDKLDIYGNKIPIYEYYKYNYYLISGYYHTYSKYFCKLESYHNYYSDGDSDKFVENFQVPITYQTVDGDDYTITCEVAETDRPGLVGVLSLSNRTLPTMELPVEVEYSLERDPWNNKDMFEIRQINLTGETDYIGTCNGKGKDENKSYTTFKLPYGATKYPDAKFGQGFFKQEINNGNKPQKGGGPVIRIYGLYFKQDDNIRKYTVYGDTSKTLYSATKYSPISLMSETYYRNKEGHEYADIAANKLVDIVPSDESYFQKCMNLPIFKDKSGKRLTREFPYRKDRLVTLLNIKAKISFITIQGISLPETFHNLEAGLEVNQSLIDAGYYESTVAIIPRWNLQFLSTDFWKHGQAGIIDITDPILPTYWYGEQHPFEFEFIVANEPGKHKIFDNLQIISNKAEPQSFHYEIVGESYEFAKDKKNMYIRQEATKEFYQDNGSDITYDHKYKQLEEEHRPLNPFKIINGKVDTNQGFDKSTIFPLYYSRQDAINEIYDYYHRITNDGKDYSALSGAELILYRNLNEIRILNNCEAINIKTHPQGRLRGNMEYKEDLWNIQINPINYVQKNEEDWATYNLDMGNIPAKSNKVPIELKNFAIPEDVHESPNGLMLDSLDRGIALWEKSESENKEVKIKDKYLKVKIRYSGKDLAIIHAINTLYTISFA